MAASEIYCDFGAGNDGSGDGTLGNPYKTFQKAHDVIKARAAPPPNHTGWGADTTVWLKGSASYLEAVLVEEETTAGGALPMTIEGYTTTPGDGGMATFDGQGAENYGFRLQNGIADTNTYYWVFKNIRFTNYATFGFLGLFGAGFFAQCTFRHCRFDHNQTGIFSVQGYKYLDCWFHDNSVKGINGEDWGTANSVLQCIFEDNARGFVTKSSGAIWNCLFRGNTVSNIEFHGDTMAVVNCVIDGQNKASAIGVDYSDIGGVVKMANTIILDCGIGVKGRVAGNEELCGIYNSLFYLNTDDFTNGAAQRRGCLFADPLFVDRDNKDYGITAFSPCKETGMDLKEFDYYTSTAGRVDIGLLQQAVSAQGAGGIGAPLGFSVER